MKTIIAGSRDIPDDIARRAILRVWKAHGLDISQVVSGTARGVDRVGEKLAKKLTGRSAKRFPADWDRYGRAEAGRIRNRQMAVYADALIAIWDGESRGTKNMVEEALELGLKVFVVTV